MASSSATDAVVSPVPSASWSDRLEYRVFRAAFRLFSSLPMEVALKVGSGLGELFYLGDVRDRRVAMFNLGMAFPEKPLAERRRILRASCRNLGRLAAEFCHLPRLQAEHLPSLITWPDRAFWDRELDKVQHTGAIILTGHFGSWELLAYAHALLGHPVTLVQRPMHNKVFDAAITEVRTGAGTRTINKRAAAKEALRVLKAHGVLAIPADQNQIFSYGVFVEFFGVPACTTTGPARLAMLTGAPIYPIFLVREGESGRHRVEALPRIELVSTGDRDADIRTNTQRCTAAIETIIRRYPEQWIWFHKRWKTRPPGQPKLYR